MVMPNYTILDLAYNWGCFGGHLLVDFDGSFFPSSDYRRRFLKKYLQEYNRAEQIELSEEEFSSELEDLFHRVSLAATGHVLKWCMFGYVFEVNDDVSRRCSSRIGSQICIRGFRFQMSILSNHLKTRFRFEP